MVTNFIQNITFFLIIGNFFPAIFAIAYFKFLQILHLKSLFIPVVFDFKIADYSLIYCKLDIPTFSPNNDDLLIMLIGVMVVTTASGILLETILSYFKCFNFGGAPKFEEGKINPNDVQIYERVHSQFIMFFNCCAATILSSLLSYYINGKSYLWFTVILCIIFLVGAAFLKKRYHEYKI